MQFAIIYLILALITGLLGKNTRIGFGGVFVASIVFSPIIVLICLLFLKEPNKKKNPGKTVATKS